MADKQEFLNELDEHLKGLRTGLEEIGQTITANAATVAALQQSRQKAIDDHVAALLPDLQVGTLAALNGILPGSVTAEQAQRLIAETRQAYQDQLDRLLAAFDPKTADAAKLQLELELQTAKEARDALLAPFMELNLIPDLKRLVKSGYGTDAYRPRWWNVQFYSDWKAADAAVEEAVAADWTELRRRFTELETNLATMQDSVYGLEQKLTALVANQASLQNLTEALGKVPATVLEQLRVKLKAQLDSLDPAPDLLKDVVSFQKRLVAVQQENAQLQETRLKLSEQVAQLHKTREQAARSRSRTVPDNYVSAVRQARTSAASGGYQNVTHVYQNDNSFLNTVLMIEMMDHFSHSSHQDSGHGRSSGSYAGSVRSSAERDYSGQS